MQTKIVTSMKQVDPSSLKSPMIVVTEHPTDYPDKYVARIHDYKAGRFVPTDTIMLKDTLKEIQEDIKTNADLMFFTRGAEDDECIVGAWL